MKSINLICFPFAGGNRYSYNFYKQIADKSINLITCELPGRGGRYGEKLLTDIEPMIEDLLVQIKDKITQPYAIYGHSMGSLLGYLLTKVIIANNLQKPMHLFLTGGNSPAIQTDKTLYHLLPKDKFINQIKELGGLESELLEHNEIIDIYEPILRADFTAIETFVNKLSPPIDIDISVMIGSEDHITFEEAIIWQNETTGHVDIREFQGDHFFIFRHEKEIMDIIKTKLNSIKLS